MCVALTFLFNVLRKFIASLLLNDDNCVIDVTFLKAHLGYLHISCFQDDANAGDEFSRISEN